MKTILVVVSLVAFLFAAASAFFSGVNLNEVGLIAVGLAAYVGSKLVRPTTT